VVADANGNVYLAEETTIVFVKSIRMASSQHSREPVWPDLAVMAASHAGATEWSPRTVRGALRGDLRDGPGQQTSAQNLVIRIITTVAGNGSNVNGGDGGAATSAGMVIPIRCAVDQNSNLFIVDQGAHRIRKVSTSGVITTYAGSARRASPVMAGPLRRRP